MKNPEVRNELALLFGTLHKMFPAEKSPEALQDRVMGYVRIYTNGYFSVRRVFEPYLEATGSTQSWNMFGGTPPRRPMVLMVEIKPRDEKDYVLYRDFNWGTAEAKQLNFRHRKTHEILGFGGWDRQREQYADYWARAWSREQPGRPAEWVRLYYLQLTTPTAERLRAGDRRRNPRRVQDFTWRAREVTPP
jgi:hypothetical protein